MNYTQIIFLSCLIIGIIPGIYADISIPGVIETGDELCISGSTNYNTDNQVSIEVFPLSFGPTAKYDSAIMGGASGIVPVTGTDGNYQWSANFSTATWSPDEYMVRVEIIGKPYTETTTFSVVEKNPRESPIPTIDADSNLPLLTETQTVAQTESPTETVTETITLKEMKTEPTQKSPVSPFIGLCGIVLVSLMAAFIHRQ